ncbi:phosphatidylglycerol lysyltransferase domain-containing protein [Mycoplasma bradburyae]|uniref:Phosphatidylglycerol lysyltransferase C-terminal domain-containing protein n=1 Tax=Mycoplasma bradburyae TaxID=2963128 RepID=A0AAW6HQ15_9MOLU|nr:phosphatidylglycerol lysyltransferase domain-containing protein [Mycoplasma bradburyae]MDC4183336.1 hypothetical protein [Mycoplasma bradburyae]UTS71110.1 hypothetical protein NMG77_01435 [Mycoplasma bradburyae]
MRRLDLSNINSFQDQINQFDTNHFYSALTYYSWSFYGLDLDYQKKDNGIIIFGTVDLDKNLMRKILKDKFYPTQKIIISPITKIGSSFDFLNLIEQQINQLDKNQQIFIDDLTSEQLELLKTKYQLEVVFETTTNYLYETKKLISFAGNSLQKKRNHLNFFLKNYAKNCVIKTNEQVNFNELEKFYLSWLAKQDNQRNYDAEKAFFYAIKELINNKTLKLTSLSHLNEMIGFSVSYSINNRCEIIIEHCDETYRGSYQYLLSNSLKIHHLNDQYTDRQDDLIDSMISFSKNSYKPAFVIKRYLVKLC